MDHSVQMFTTDSVTAMSSGKIVAQTGKFEQTSMTDDNPGVELVGDEKVELVYKNRITNEEASIDLVNADNSSNNAKIHVDNPRGNTCLIIDKNRRLGVGNISPSAILHLHNHNNTNSEHLRITNNDTLGLNLVLSTSNTDVKAIFGTRWYNSGTTTTVSNALVIRNLNGTNQVGIGTSSPSYTLDVSGNINFTGNLTQNGSTFGNPYTLPIASSSTLGGIKVGNNLSINGSGVLSATDTNTTYSVGDGGLTQNNFTNALKTKLDGIDTGANYYSLPAATTTSLGGIKVGTNLSIDNSTGVLSATDTNTTYTVGDGGLTQNNFTNALKTKLDSLSNYSLPIASTSTLGGVKVDGSTVTIDSSGIITSNSTYTLPNASTTTLGGIKVGTNLSIDGNGVLSSTDTNTTYSVGDGGLTHNNFTNALKTKLDGIATSANNYSLPIASTSSLGGIKVGNNLSIDISTGVLSATDTNTTYTVGDGGLTQNNFTNTLKTKLDSLSNYSLPTSSTSTLGGVKVDGSTITINGSGVISSSTSYSLPIASTSSLGGIKVGNNLSIDSSTGVLSATDTNTTYSVGDGGLTQNNFTDTLKTKLDGIATSANNYSLPIAGVSTLGGIKVGNNLSIDSGTGVLSSTNTTYSVGDGGLTQNNFTDALKTKLDGMDTSANNYSLPTSSTSTLGGVKVDGSTITINGSGVISSSGGGGSGYTLPTASSSTLGGIKVGTGLSIDSSTGVLSAGTASSSTLDGQILETLAGVCDGRSVTVESGSYTLPNVTTYYTVPTTSYGDFPGSAISYKPPSDTKQVIYKFKYHTGPIDTNYSMALKFFLGGTEVTSAKSHTDIRISHGYTDDFYYIIDIGNVSTDDIANGKLASWNNLKEMKLQITVENNNFELYVNHNRYEYSGNSYTTGHYVRKPRLMIQAIGQSSPQSAILPTASSSTLGGIKVGTGLTIDSSTSVLSTNQWTTSGSDIYRSSGNVGIGTNSFVDSRNTGGLHITNEKGISFKANTSQTDSRNWRIKPDDLGPWGSLGFCVSDSNSTTPGASADHGDVTMILTRDKRVGIGTTSPSTALHIYTIDGSENTGSRHQINASGGTSGSGGSGYLSLRVRGRSWFEDFTFHTSDSRIKKEIEDVPDKLALEQVRNIPCKYYKYVDTYEKGENKTIGFIAQEVRSVLPMAVSIETGIIPNVYTNILDVTWEEITETNVEKSVETKKYKMRTSTLTNISGVKYKFYVSNTENDEVEKIVIGNDDSTFTFEQQWTNVFCYGYEVEDFHVLDKNKLFVLNFSATQEIDRIQQQELTKVKDLEIENFLLKERVKDLETKMNDVLNRLAQLENN